MSLGYHESGGTYVCLRVYIKYWGGNNNSWGRKRPAGRPTDLPAGNLGFGEFGIWRNFEIREIWELLKIRNSENRSEIKSRETDKKLVLCKV